MAEETWRSTHVTLEKAGIGVPGSTVSPRKYMPPCTGRGQAY